MSQAQPIISFPCSPPPPSSSPGALHSPRCWTGTVRRYLSSSKTIAPDYPRIVGIFFSQWSKPPPEFLPPGRSRTFFSPLLLRRRVTTTSLPPLPTLRRDTSPHPLSAIISSPFPLCNTRAEYSDPIANVTITASLPVNPSANFIDDFL